MQALVLACEVAYNRIGAGIGVCIAPVFALVLACELGQRLLQPLSFTLVLACELGQRPLQPLPAPVDCLPSHTSKPLNPGAIVPYLSSRTSHTGKPLNPRPPSTAGWNQYISLESQLRRAGGGGEGGGTCCSLSGLIPSSCACTHAN